MHVMYSHTPALALLQIQLQTSIPDNFQYASLFSSSLHTILTPVCKKAMEYVEQTNTFFHTVTNAAHPVGKYNINSNTQNLNSKQMGYIGNIVTEMCSRCNRMNRSTACKIA